MQVVSSHKASSDSDVYSLGCTAWELLHGRLCFNVAADGQVLPEPRFPLMAPEASKGREALAQLASRCAVTHAYTSAVVGCTRDDLLLLPC